MTAQPQMEPDAGSPDAGKLMRRSLQVVWNDETVHTIDERFPRDSVRWGVSRPDASSRGPEEFRAFFQAMRKTFSDIRIELEDVVAQEDLAYTRFSVTGEHG